jgi:peptidoglycan hydrolase-like protein with peptidoglycan-binding domain
LGITHRLFVPRSSGGSGEYLFSRGLKSWVDLEEGFQKAEEVVRSLGRLQQVLKALTPPQAYRQLRTFLDVVCNENDYFSDFQPLQQFLNNALQPATPVSPFELKVRAIGYILKPIVGWLFILVLLVVCVVALWQIVSWFLSSLLNTLASVVFAIILWFLWHRPKKDSFALAVILILFTVLITRKPPVEPIATNPDFPNETIQTNHDTFSQLKSELRPITLGSDENFLAQKIASQETSINAEDAIFQLSSEESPQVLFDWIKAFQKASGLEETGKLTTEDPLYHVLKRRTSRDIAIDANYPFWLTGTPVVGSALKRLGYKSVEDFQEVRSALKRLGYKRVEDFQSSQQLDADGIAGPGTQAKFKEVLKTNLNETIDSLKNLTQSIATDCNKTDNSLIPKLTQELTGSTDDNVLNWSEIIKENVDINGADVGKFETAIVLYKYPIESTPGTYIDPLPTLIKGQDDSDLYDLELGIRQQIKCWDGLSDPPPDP